MKPKKLPSHKTLSEYLHYDPNTGEVRLKRRTSQRTPAGTVVGSVSTSGYLVMNLFGETYYVARLVWKLVTGEEPSGQVDHINRDKLDNRWANLRDVSCSQNNLNRMALGYSKLPNGRYRATLLGKDIGYFNCPTAAHFAYLRAKKEVYGGYCLGLRS